MRAHLIPASATDGAAATARRRDASAHSSRVGRSPRRAPPPCPSPRPSSPPGEIHFTDLVEPYLVTGDDLDSKKQFAFGIKTADRMYLQCADNLAEYTSWNIKVRGRGERVRA